MFCFLVLNLNVHKKWNPLRKEQVAQRKKQNNTKTFLIYFYFELIFNDNNCVVDVHLTMNVKQFLFSGITK